MRILLISPLPPPAGGIAVWTKQYIRYMEDLGHSVDIVNTAVLKNRVNNYSRHFLVEEIYRTFKIFFGAIRFLSRNRYDIVHLNTSCAETGLIRDRMLSIILCVFKTKIITQCHCNIESMVHSQKAKNNLKSILDKSVECLVLNRFSQEFLRQNFGMYSRIVPNFISEEYITVAQQKKDNNQNLKNVLYVGHLAKTKGCDVIIEAARSFPELQFRLVGKDCMDIEQYNYSENVTVTGEMSSENLRKEYEAADVLLFPTHTEGFPLTIIEAMAYGLPIITTEVGAIPDILEDTGAVYIKVNDVESLKNGINKISDIEIRKRMSYFNQKKVLSEYTIDKVIDSMCKIYSEI